VTFSALLAFSKTYYQPQYKLLPNFATTIMRCNYLDEWKVKKGKFHPRTGHEGPEGE
jgi:hypothetical protein